MEDRTDVLKAEKIDQERRGILDDVMKEITLFNIRQDEEDQSDLTACDDAFPNVDLDLYVQHTHPPGIQFFYGDVNCIYDLEAIKPKLKLKWLQVQSLSDASTLQNIEQLIRYECILRDSDQKNIIFKFFFKFLFTDQSECVLEGIALILIEIITRTRQTNALLKIVLQDLPAGVQNLGGRAHLVFPSESLPSSTGAAETQAQSDYNPLSNIKYVLKVLKSLVIKESNLSKDKLPMASADLDNLLFLFLAVSHDPRVLRSSLLSSVQDFLSVCLDLYPSDSAYSEKVQDVVERLGIYWDDSPAGFDHHTAAFVTCNLFPYSARGRHLRASLAYYALMCCLTPEESEVLDVVHLCRLSRFCHESVDAIKAVNSYTLNSVFKLVDAAIDRPLHSDRDREDLMSILKTMKTVQMSKDHENDLFNKTKLVAFIKEITSEWESLLEKGKRSSQ